VRAADTYPVKRPPVPLLTAGAATLALALACWLAVLVAVVAVLILGKPVGLLLDDPAVVLGGPWYAGYLSMFGVLLWWLSGWVSLVIGLVLRAHGRAEAPALVLGGLLLLWLGLDDAFLIHDQLLPQARIDERIAFAAYAVLVAAYTVRFRRFLLDGPWLVPAVGAALLAFSVVVDVGDSSWDFVTPAIEDIPKLLAIATFAAYFVVRAFDLLLRTLDVPAGAVFGIRPSTARSSAGEDAMAQAAAQAADLPAEREGQPAPPLPAHRDGEGSQDRLPAAKRPEPPPG
jgi:hypothetical protein